MRRILCLALVGIFVFSPRYQALSLLAAEPKVSGSAKAVVESSEVVASTKEASTSARKSASPSPSSSPAELPSLTPTPVPTFTPAPTATPSSSLTPTPTALPTPTFTPTPSSTPSAAPSPTLKPTPQKKRPLKKPALFKKHFQGKEPIEIFLGDYDAEALKVVVINSKGEEVLFKKRLDTEKIQLSFPQSFRPGKYTLRVSDGGEVVFEDDFSWGVLAINTHKSIYLPNEQVRFEMAVLDEQGMMVCDASLKLKIRNEKLKIEDELSTDQGTIWVNPECQVHDYTTEPDYEARYQVKGVGIYELELTAETQNGTYTVTDAFEVRERIAFEIERDSATRIYPPKPYPVTFQITAYQDFEGIVQETVPVDFKILPALNNRSYDKVETRGEAKVLQWNVSVKADDKLSLGYRFDAPDISPQFYLLGPLTFQELGKERASDLVFTEARQWQIAADAPDVPVIENYTEQWNTSPSTTLTFSKPSGAQVGELLLIIAVNDDTSTTAFTDNKSGWNFIANFGDGTSDSHIGLFWRIADGTEGATEQVTSAGSDEWGGWYVRISGVDTSNPINAAGTATTQNGVSSITASAVTTDVDDCLALCFGSFDGGDGNDTAPFGVSGTGWSYEDDGSSGTSGLSDASGVWGKKSMTGTQGSTLNATVSSDGTSDGMVGAQIAIAPEAITTDVTVSAIASQTTSMVIPSTDNYVGGAFVITENTSSRNVTGITIAEQGDVDAQNDLSNIELYYETSSDCSSESYGGSENQFGSTASSFNGANGTASFSGTSVGITTSSEMCVYAILDVDDTANENDELEIQISDPSTEVTVEGGGTVGPGSAVAISGTTTLTLPGVTGSLGKSEDGWSGAIPVYMTLDGLDNGDYPYARAKVDTPATETYYTSMTWDTGDERYEGTIYVGSWYCNGCADPNTGSYSVTVQLDDDAQFGSIDYSDATSGFSTWVTRRKSGTDTSTNYTDILPVWNTDHWDVAVNDFAIQTASGTESNVAIAIPFHPTSANISNLSVSFNGSPVSEGSAESTTDAWWWDSSTHTLYVQKASLGTTLVDVDLDFDADTDLWATRFDRVQTKDMGNRTFYNGLFMGNQYITTSVYGGAGQGSQPSWEGSGEQAESRAKESGASAEDSIDCMERVGVWVDDNTNCDSSTYYNCNVKWKQDEWDDILLTADNDQMIIEVNSDDDASNGWEQQKDYGIAVKRTQTFYAGEKYIQNVYEITNGDSSSHELSMVWGREQWLSSDQEVNDRGRADGDSSDRTIEARVTPSGLTCPWFAAYDSSAYNAMGVIFEDGDPGDYGYWLSNAPIQNSAIAEWPIDYGQTGTYAENTFFEKVYSSVSASETVTFTFWQWGYDTTSWANIESAIDADCEALNVSNNPPNNPSSSAQKKTDDTTLNVGDWTDETSVKFTATVSDPDPSDTLYLCVEAQPLGTGFTNSETDCGTGVTYSGSPVSASVTLSGLSDNTQYHWQARVKDAAAEYSSWVAYGGNGEAERDFGIDTTAPTGGTVYDGTEAGVDKDYNDGSLSQLSANWTGFDASASDLNHYEYSIGTTTGGTDVKTWTGNGTSTSVTATSLDLQTSIVYYFNVRAVDNAGNVQSSPPSSDGQIVSPSLSFSVSPSTLSFANLNASNNYTDSEPATLTTSTNAYGGYLVRAYVTDYLRSVDSNFTIGDFDGGSYTSPDEWLSGDRGYGYTSSDTTIQGADKFSSNPCSGGGTPPCYAPFSHTGPGDILADHTDNVTGSPISNEEFTVTHQVKTDDVQEASAYVTTVVYTVNAQY